MNFNFLGDVKNHCQSFKDILMRLKLNGDYSYPRKLKIIELENFNYVLEPYVRFCNFESRKLNINYIKKEFLWYVKGDKFDTSIGDEAKMWKGLVNKDGSINSNYGQYIFGKQKQFDRCLNELKNDECSRRASIMILSREHLDSETLDFPCTYSMNFRIRKNKLNMTVRMRSQDGIFGMGNDSPCFSFIHEMMFVSLKEFYPELEYGNYYHSCDSFHVYERHFNMLDEITKEDSIYSLVECPKISCKEEVDFLINCDYRNIPDSFEFSKWLINN